MEQTPAWSLEELSRRAVVALQATPGARLPDARSIRWYASIGLVDRPVGGRGRGARYGPRHLRQLVAVRRLQAQGWSLADIQGRLVGADDATLEALADLPGEALAMGRGAVGARPDPVLDGAVPSRVAGRPVDAFWRTSAVVEIDRPAHGAPPGARPRVPASGQVASGPIQPGPPGAVRLAGGAVLVLPRQPTPEELSLLAEAAAPLVEVLARLGLAADPLATDSLATDPPTGPQPPRSSSSPSSSPSSTDPGALS